MYFISKYKKKAINVYIPNKQLIITNDRYVLCHEFAFKNKRLSHDSKSIIAHERFTRGASIAKYVTQITSDV